MSSPIPTYQPQNKPEEVSQLIVSASKKKVSFTAWRCFLLALLAGLYISIGGHLSLVALAGNMGRIVAGFVFSVGLVFVVIAGAELFTGNATMFIGAARGVYPFSGLLKNWIIAYMGNLIGSYLCAVLIAQSGLLGTVASPSPVGSVAKDIAAAKMNLPFAQAFIRGIFCNLLVVLAIIMALFAKDVISKIVCCMLPIMAFVASGYEHCVANMYLLPLGLFAKGAPLHEHLAIWGNIVPVTLGNIVGGVFIMLVHPDWLRQLLRRQRPA